MIRKALDKLYISSGAIASLLIAGICLLVCTQVFFNLITRFGGQSVNLSIPSYGDFAGYMLAASSFLALAYTLTQGGHIRVNLVLTRLPVGARWYAEILSTSVCAIVSGYVTFYMGKLCRESYEFGDLSPGIVAVPIWIPQSFVLVGMIILTVALFDCLLRILISRVPVFSAAELKKEDAE
ncbi:MAG: TRAP transporter small permease [Granulosicoccus sp.]